MPKRRCTERSLSEATSKDHKENVAFLILPGCMNHRGTCGYTAATSLPLPPLCLYLPMLLIGSDNQEEERLLFDSQINSPKQAGSPRGIN